MFWLKTIVVASLLTTALSEDVDTSSIPLCSIPSVCYCNKKIPVQVTCIKEIKDIISNRSYWLDSKNNSYPYGEVTLAAQNFIELNFTFPASNITYLNLAKSDIYRIKNAAFKNLQNMTTLILSFNNLDILSHNAFQGIETEGREPPLKSLKELRLDNNRLHTLNADIFKHTTDLEILDLSHNPFERIDTPTLTAISSLACLKELYLSHTQLKTLPDTMLHTPYHLEILDLSGNPIEKMPATLAEAHNLTVLYLNYTGFVNLTTENGFPLMPTLKILYLCHLTELERIEKGALAGLVNLEELHISDNIKLHTIDAFALAQTNKDTGGAIWPAIKKLYLGNNKLSYLDSDIIARWDALTSLDIRANPWTCECENQWLVEDLMPVWIKLDKTKASQVRCGAPIEMVGYTFIELYEKKYKMRCLDEYDARPEQDAVMLVGILAGKSVRPLYKGGCFTKDDRIRCSYGVLIAIPIILFTIYAYQRRYFGIFSMCDKSAASYSRRFYSATSNHDEYF